MAAFNAWDLSLASCVSLLAAAMALLCVLANFPKVLREERAKVYKSMDSYIASRLFVSAVFGGIFVSCIYSSILLADRPDWVAIAPLLQIAVCVLYLLPVAADIAIILERKRGASTK